MEEPNDIFLSIPVLDGADPAAWDIWEMKFAAACDAFYKAPRNIAATFEYDERVRLSILLQPEKKLYQRTDKQWSGIVGLLVDGSGDEATRAATLKRVLQICANIKSDDALYRKLKQFRIGVLLPNDEAADQQVENFQRMLELEVGQRLGVPVDCDSLTNVGEFRGFLRNYERKLVRDWVVNAVKAA